jgi:type IV pilus assembly protein PilF
MLKQTVRQGFWFLVAAMLTACVTTNTGGLPPAASDDEAIEVHVDAAKQYLGARDFESARRHLKKAMELAPKSPDVHDALALTFHASGEIELAEKHYKKAVSYGDGGSRYRINYANLLYQQQKYDQAEKQLEIIADDSLYEKRESALLLLGLTQQQLLNTSAAMRSFERALVLNPNNLRVLRELSIMRYEASDYPAAWESFMHMREVAGQLNAEMLLLGIHLARELENTDAQVSFALALKNLHPDSVEYQAYLRELQRTGSEAL